MPDLTDLRGGPQFGWETRAVAGRTLLAVYGEFDRAEAEAFEAAVREQLHAGPVLLDLRELTFMDSSGVRVLDAVVRDASAEGWSLTIGAQLQPAVRQLFELTGVMRTLPFEELGDRDHPA